MSSLKKSTVATNHNHLKFIVDPVLSAGMKLLRREKIFGFGNDLGIMMAGTLLDWIKALKKHPHANDVS
jgi:hypothetical protein